MQTAHVDPFAASNPWQGPAQPQNAYQGNQGPLPTTEAPPPNSQAQFGASWPAAGPTATGGYGPNYQNPPQGFNQPPPTGFNPYFQVSLSTSDCL